MTRSPQSEFAAQAAAAGDALITEMTASGMVAEALGGGPLAVHETHAARVLVGSALALKIKRPVRYPYLDFSTLELRHAALAREMELNQPHAPDIYLRLVRVTREADGMLALDGAGHALEHALLMRRFEQQDVLSSRLREDKALSPEVCKALGDMVARYHAEAPPARVTDAAQRMVRLAADVARGLAGQPTVLDSALGGVWWHSIEAAISNAATVMTRRARGRCIRRCHGDLHSGNIVLWQGAPVAFDALEFDEALATTDTLYDLAFLIMDLDVGGHRPEANAVLNRYLWRTGADIDLEGLAALPVFLSLRAAIRAMVGAQKCALEEGAARERDAAAARSYLDAARRYLGDTAPPRLIAVGGLSGTGKSTLGAALAPVVGRAPGALHLRSDLERKAMFHVEETARLPADTYNKASSDAVYGRVLDRADRALGAGQSVLLDAVWLAAEEQEAARELARVHGARFDGLWLTAPVEVLRARVDARRGDASDATAKVVDKQAQVAANLAGWPEIDASGTPQDALANALRRLGL